MRCSEDEKQKLLNLAFWFEKVAADIEKAQKLGLNVTIEWEHAGPFRDIGEFLRQIIKQNDSEEVAVH